MLAPHAWQCAIQVGCTRENSGISLMATGAAASGCCWSSLKRRPVAVWPAVHEATTLNSDPGDYQPAPPIANKCLGKPSVEAELGKSSSPSRHAVRSKQRNFGPPFIDLPP